MYSTYCMYTFYIYILYMNLYMYSIHIYIYIYVYMYVKSTCGKWFTGVYIKLCMYTCNSRAYARSIYIVYGFIYVFYTYLYIYMCILS